VTAVSHPRCGDVESRAPAAGRVFIEYYATRDPARNGLSPLPVDPSGGLSDSTGRTERCEIVEPNERSCGPCHPERQRGISCASLVPGQEHGREDPSSLRSSGWQPDLDARSIPLPL